MQQQHPRPAHPEALGKLGPEGAASRPSSQHHLPGRQRLRPIDQLQTPTTQLDGWGQQLANPSRKAVYTGPRQSKRQLTLEHPGVHPTARQGNPTG